MKASLSYSQTHSNPLSRICLISLSLLLITIITAMLVNTSSPHLRMAQGLLKIFAIKALQIFASSLHHQSFPPIIAIKHHKHYSVNTQQYPLAVQQHCHTQSSFGCRKLTTFDKTRPERSTFLYFQICIHAFFARTLFVPESLRKEIYRYEKFIMPWNMFFATCECGT